jgi:uncharacterized membrane protein
METSLVFALALFAAIGSALVAGVFFAFSSFVMRALGRLPYREGIGAMQSVNLVVLRSGFLAVFLGTGALCLVTLVLGVLRWGEPGAGYMVAGSVLYLLGSLGVTIVFNVPRNEALAAVRPSDETSEPVWAGYLLTWTRWNHVRTIASLAAALAFVLALVA